MNMFTYDFRSVFEHEENLARSNVLCFYEVKHTDWMFMLSGFFFRISFNNGLIDKFENWYE